MNNTALDADDAALELLKGQMTEQQRKDMAEIISNELKRREGLKQEQVRRDSMGQKSAVKSSRMSGSLRPEDLADMYKDVGTDIQAMRVRALEAKLEDAKRQADRISPFQKKKRVSGGQLRMPQVNFPIARFPSASGIRLNRNVLLVLGVLCIAGVKVLYSQKSEDTSATVRNEQSARASLQAPLTVPEVKQVKENIVSTQDAETERVAAVAAAPAIAQTWTAAEKEVLLSLDARRVDLERRRSSLEQKEKEVQAQSQALAERLAELRTLTTRLATLREEKDHRYEARMEQLSNVYGSMAPNEAAQLMGKLDEDVALELLERMPGKRMGQILGVMDPVRAIDLTKSLTDKRKL